MREKKLGRKLAIAACTLALTACAMDDDDNVVGSQLSQPPAGTRRPPSTEAGDIAIVGQDVAHDITGLPPIASATIPPLVRFNGVTSIIQPPIDTEPYTELLRDRLLLLTREKLRFVEHTLPPYIPGEKHKHVPQPTQNITDPDYEVLAEMRGHADSDTYRIQIEFVDMHSHDILYNETFRINKEAESQPSTGQYVAPMAPPPAATATPQAQPQTETGKPPGYYDPPSQPSNDYEPPPTKAPKNEGNNGIL